MDRGRGIVVTETDASITIAWDNRDVSRGDYLGCALILFWLVWAPATLFFTAAAFFMQGFVFAFFVVWLAFGWFGTIEIPLTLLSRGWRESISVDATAITLQSSGPFAPRPKILALDQVAEMFFGRYPPNSSDSEIVFFVRRTNSAPFWARRQLLGYWLSNELKEKVFLTIEAFAVKHDISLRTQRSESRDTGDGQHCY